MAKDYTIAYLFDLYGAALTDKQRALVEYYYNDDLSLSEISENPPGRPGRDQAGREPAQGMGRKTRPHGKEQGTVG